MIDHQIWVFTCFNRNFPDKFMWKVLVETWFHRVPNRSRWPGAGAVVAFPVVPVLFFLAVDILEIEVSISDICKSQSKYVDFCNFSPDLLKFINETSGYHQ